jgi:pimeloyl-ACP methyl ester carboxylesterase
VTGAGRDSPVANAESLRSERFGIGGEDAASEGDAMDAGVVVERLVELPGRGITVVWDCPGPPSAPAVVLVHGVTLTAGLNWSAVMPALAGSFRVLAFDQRGHGQGLGWAGDYRLEDCADDVAAVAAALGIDRLIVVGYSMGELIAQLVCRRHRRLTAALVLCATARSLTGSTLVDPTAALTQTALTSCALLCPALLAATMRAPAPPLLGWTRPVWALAAPARRRPTPDGTTDHAGFPAVAALRADLLGRYLHDPDCDPDRRARALAHMRRTPLLSALAAVSAVYRFSSHAWATNIDVPTAVIIPSRDRIISRTHQDKLAAAIPAAVTYELDGDHGVFLTDPDRFLAALHASCHDVGARR